MITTALYGVNKTADNKILLGGIFRMYIEQGFPIADSLKFVLENSATFQFCVEEFIFNALAELWDDTKIINTLSEAYRDSGLEQPPYDLNILVKTIIWNSWNKTESFERLGKRQIEKYRTEGFEL